MSIETQIGGSRSDCPESRTLDRLAAHVLPVHALDVSHGSQHDPTVVASLVDDVTFRHLIVGQLVPSTVFSARLNCIGDRPCALALRPPMRADELHDHPEDDQEENEVADVHRRTGYRLPEPRAGRAVPWWITGSSHFGRARLQLFYR